MKGNFKSLTDLATEVERIEAAKEDYRADTRSLTMVEDGKGLVIDKTNGGGTLFGINDYAHGQIAQAYNIPRPYYDRMLNVPGLRAANVNAWMDKVPSVRTVRTLDGNVRAFLSDRFRPLDNIILLRAMLPALSVYPDLQVKASALTETRMYLQVVFPNKEADVKAAAWEKQRGHLTNQESDIVWYGLTFRNSEVGAGAYDIEEMLWRQWCNNGAITESVMRKFHVGARLGGDDEGANIFRNDTIRAEMELIQRSTRDILNAALSSNHFEQLVGKAAAAVGDTFDNPVQVVEKVTSRYGLSNAQAETMLVEMAKPQNGYNRWGLMNSITALAHAIDSPDKGYEVEKLGADILNIGARDWKALTAN